MTRMLLLLISSFLFVNCAFLVEKRSFSHEMGLFSDPFFIPGEDFIVLPGDSGQVSRTVEEIEARTPLSESDDFDRREERLLSEELKRKEGQLSWEAWNHYQQVRDKLNLRSDKIYYLDLSSRDRSFYQKGINQGVRQREALRSGP